MMLPLGEETVRGELAEDGGAQGADPGPAQAGSHTQEAGGARWSGLNLMTVFVTTAALQRATIWI